MIGPLPQRVALFLALTVALIGPSIAGEFDVQGHRGCRGLMPENSVPAFRRALELGVTTLELDVQLTVDRVPVVYHDEKLDGRRCVGPAGGPIPREPLTDLASSDLVGIECEQTPVPRLAEVLDLALAAAYPVRLSIEIKLHGSPSVTLDEIAAVIVGEVRERGLVARTIIQSFDLAVLESVHRMAPELQRSYLVRKPGRYDAVLDAPGIPILSPRYGQLRRRVVERMQAAGVTVIPWTVNKPAAIREMIEWGVDGIITDYPDRVLAILAED